MKKMFLMLAVVIFFGCVERESTNPLFGPWKSISLTSEEVVMTFTETTFEIDLDGKKGKDIWGTYTVKDSQITFQNSGGGFSPPCGEPGIYDFNISDNKLTFRMINDQCPSRMDKMKEIWKKAEQQFINIAQADQDSFGLKSRNSALRTSQL